MDDPLGVLASILPEGAVAAEFLEGEEDDFTELLHAEELEAIQGAAAGRRREFAAGRECARRALQLLGAEPCSLPMGVDGAPVWPAGVVGSITHKGRYRAAAVAYASQIAGLGIDAELDEPLPEGVLERIASPRELLALQPLVAGGTGTSWDRLLFSAKEAAVKASCGLLSHPVAVRSARTDLDTRASTFGSTIGPVTSDAGEQLSVSGGWVVSDGMLLCAASLPPH